MNLKCSTVNDDIDSSSRKRSRRSPRESEVNEVKIDDNYNKPDLRLFEVEFPKDYEAAFASAIFELGLKHSSPKLIMPLMPIDKSLSTEHIKSHLQKYRIHHHRSKEEFLTFYNNNIRHSFHAWEERRGWEDQHSTAMSRSNSHKSLLISKHLETAKPIGTSEPLSNSNSDETSDAQVSKTLLFKKADEMIKEWRNLYQESTNHKHPK